MNGKVMPVRIVPMKTEHLDAVAELERSCFTVPWSRNALAEELDNALSAFLVALDENDRVVGYAGLQVVLDEGYITNVAVRPDCRRRGVAGKLLDVFERFAEGNHLAFLSLEVRASNYAAIALYGQHGYRGVGRRRNYYEHPKEDAVIMTREFGEAAKGGYWLLNPPATRNQTAERFDFSCDNTSWQRLCCCRPASAGGRKCPAVS